MKKTIFCCFLSLLFVVSISACSKNDSLVTSDLTEQEISISSQTLYSINSQWNNSFSSEQKASPFFSAEVTENWGNSIDFELNLSSENDDLDSALQLFDSYYPVAKSISASYGLTISSYWGLIYFNTTPIASFSTEDGETYSVLQNGVKTTITIER